MQRMKCRVVFCTDGAPDDDYFWKRHGTQDAYREVRRREAAEALQLAAAEGHIILPVRDQQLFRNLPGVADALLLEAESFHPDAIFTLAYEGGHPDHDACALLSWWLGTQRGVPVWESPLYHLAKGAASHQEFIDRIPDGSNDASTAGSNDSAEWDVELTPAELEVKQAMFRAYRSQGAALVDFCTAVERLRPQARYDFCRPAHPGKLNYENWEWSMTGEQVCSAFAEFLDLRGAPPQRGRSREQRGGRP